MSMPVDYLSQFVKQIDDKADVYSITKSLGILPTTPGQNVEPKKK